MEAMKVFISWSGDASKAVAEVLRQWLPSVLQAVRPYFSRDDIAKGSRWLAEVGKELEASRVGLIAVTPDNRKAPWLMFEAGALAKNLESSRVIPVLFGGLAATDIEGPLAQFQAAPFCRDEMKRVIKTINDELREAALGSEILDRVFDKWWPDLEKQVNEAWSKTRSGDKVQRPERELLEEILALTRQMARSEEGELRAGRLTSDLVDILMYTRFLAEASARSSSPAIRHAARSLLDRLRYLQRRGVLEASWPVEEKVDAVTRIGETEAGDAAVSNEPE